MKVSEKFCATITGTKIKGQVSKPFKKTWLYVGHTELYNSFKNVLNVKK